MKKLLLLSGKGGTGKTTTAAAFAKFSQAKALADCDVDAPNLHLLFGKEPPTRSTPFAGSEKAYIQPELCIGCGRCLQYCRFHALSLVEGKASINEYFCEGCGVCAQVCPHVAPRLIEDVAGQQLLYQQERTFATASLKMGRGNSGKLVTAVKTSLFHYAPVCDLAIIDGSPGIGCPVLASMSGVDLVLLVAEPSLSGLSDVKRLVQTAQGLNTKLALCINKYDSSPQHTAALEAFCKEQQLPLVGRIPYDATASQAINQGLSLADFHCPAQLALQAAYVEVLKLLELA